MFKFINLGAIIAVLCGGYVFADINRSETKSLESFDQEQISDKTMNNLLNSDNNSVVEEVSKINNTNQYKKIHLKTWMTECQEYLNDKYLKDIAIPGTHDSGTGTMSEDDAVWSSDDKSVNIPFTQKDEIFAVKWSKTQDKSIKEQLDVGVRFLDFRLSLKEISKDDYKQSNRKKSIITMTSKTTKQPKYYELYLSHGLLGEHFESVLEDVASFCKENKQELVLIKIKGIANKKYGINVNRSIIKLLDKKLKEYIVSAKKIPILPKATFSKIISEGNVVVLFEDKAKEDVCAKYPWLYDCSACLKSAFAGTSKVKTLFEFLKKEINQVEKDKTNKNKLCALHWILTADAKYLVSHLRNTLGIRYLTDKINQKKYKKYRLKNLVAQIPRVNIVQHDFINKKKVSYLIQLNVPDRKIKVINDIIPKLNEKKKIK